MDAALLASSEAALAHILVPDLATRTAAERFIATHLAKHIVAGPVYAQLVAGSQHDSVRQLAGVLLRRHVNGWYGHVKTSKETRAELPRQLISLLVLEASRPPVASCPAGTKPFSRPICKALIRCGRLFVGEYCFRSPHFTNPRCPLATHTAW